MKLPHFSFWTSYDTFVPIGHGLILFKEFQMPAGRKMRQHAIQKGNLKFVVSGHAEKLAGCLKKLGTQNFTKLFSKAQPLRRS